MIERNKAAIKRTIIFMLLAILAICYAWVPTKTDTYIKSRSVRLFNSHMSCSGVQVHAPSGKDYILSAGHCHDIAVNEIMTVSTEDGKVLQRRVIEEDKSSDLLLIEGIPNLRGLDIAKAIHMAEPIRTFTHGSALPTYETKGVLIAEKEAMIPIFIIESQEKADKCASMPKYKSILDIVPICVLDTEEMATTAMIVPGSSGGMAVDDSGDVVGIASATDMLLGYLVTLHDIQNLVYNY